uniref:Serpentine receptor class gamma n=1 Tax=Panagrellus redivivus TaxID=6233 RepID=A0A7E4W1G6_PANRE
MKAVIVPMLLSLFSPAQNFITALIPFMFYYSYYFCAFFLFTFSAFRVFAYNDLITIQFYSMDAAMLVPGWSLLLTSHDFRRAFLQLLGFASPETETPPSITLQTHKSRIY